MKQTDYETNTVSQSVWSSSACISSASQSRCRGTFGGPGRWNGRPKMRANYALVQSRQTVLLVRLWSLHPRSRLSSAWKSWSLVGISVVACASWIWCARGHHNAGRSHFYITTTHGAPCMVAAKLAGRYNALELTIPRRLVSSGILLALFRWRLHIGQLSHVMWIYSRFPVGSVRKNSAPGDRSRATFISAHISARWQLSYKWI